MPERVDFWGIPHTWGPPELYVYSIMFLAGIILLIRFYRHASLWWRVGRPEARWDHLLTRIGRLINYAIVQIRVLSRTLSGGDAPWPGMGLFRLLPGNSPGDDRFPHV